MTCFKMLFMFYGNGILKSNKKLLFFSTNAWASSRVSWTSSASYRCQQFTRIRTARNLWWWLRWFVASYMSIVQNPDTNRLHTVILPYFGSTTYPVAKKIVSPLGNLKFVITESHIPKSGCWHSIKNIHPRATLTKFALVAIANMNEFTDTCKNW